MHRVPLLLIPLACAPALDTDDGGTVPTPSDAGQHVRHADEAGAVVTVIDASAEDTWVYLDLETKLEVTPGDPRDSEAWDLGFQRFSIVTNGGVSGPGAMEGAILEGVSFDEVDRAPSEGWIEDAADGEDMDTSPDTVFFEWYAYDFMTHVLTPHPLVFVVRSVEGNHFAIAIEDYYDDAGTSGFPTLRWKPIADPS